MTTAQAILYSFILLVGFCWALGFMVFAFWKKIQAFGYISVGGAFLIAGVGFLTSAGVGDIYFILGWFGIGLSILGILEALALGKEEDEDNDIKEYQIEIIARRQGYLSKENREELREERRERISEGAANRFQNEVNAKARLWASRK